MEKLSLNSMIKVYNTGLSPVCVEANKGSAYNFGAINEGIPYVLEIPLSDLKIINQKSNIFREGFLTFDDDVKEAVYNELMIKDWKNILTNEQIEDIILHPTKDGLNRLLSVRTFVGFERIKGIFTREILIKSNDVSLRVKTLINKRQEEFNNGKFITSLKVEDSDVINSEDEVSSLKKQLEEMKKQMAELIVKSTAEKKTTTTTKKSVK